MEHDRFTGLFVIISRSKVLVRIVCITIGARFSARCGSRRSENTQLTTRMTITRFCSTESSETLRVQAGKGDECCMRISETRQKNDRQRGVLLWYTVLYALLFGFILCFFIAEHRSLVYHADAWRQHLRAYAYYGKWLRGCAWNLLHGKGLSLQTWSFGLGYGADVLTTLQYYCFGEPLAFLNILVPERFCKLYFEFLIVLRPYLAGLAFTAYVRYTFPNIRRIPLLSGALSYSFCGTVLYLGMLHPFFVTPMIYFPLLLLGAERVLQERRPMVFMLSVWMAGISNFYFFYMLALLTAGYGVCRVAFRMHREHASGNDSDGRISEDAKRKGAEARVAGNCSMRTGRVPAGKQRSAAGETSMRAEWRMAAAELGRLLGYAVIGTMAAGAILIPVLVQFQSDPRGATEFSLSLFYEPAYYQELFKNLVTFINHPLYDTELCMSIFAVAALIVLFIRRGHRQLKTAVIGCIALLCFPVAGYLLNGTSYVINRWTFAAEFLLALVLAVVWNACTARFACRRGMGRHLERVALAGLVACIAGNIYLGYARIPADANGEGGQSGYASEFTDAQTPAEYMQAAYRNEAAAIQSYESSEGGTAGSGVSGTGAAGETETLETQAADKSFLRYSGRDLTYNAGAQLGHSSTQFFWSFASGAVSDFFQALGVNEEQNFCYTGLDDRAALEALAGVQYYSIAYDNSFEQKFVPYGFTDIGTVAGESGVPEEVREELAEDRQGGIEQGAFQGEDQAGNPGIGQDMEQGSVQSQDGAVAADGTIQESSGAVLGDDSWEPVRPEYHLYSSMFALPLGYTYTGVLSQEEFAAMTPTQRQEAIVQGVLLGDAELSADNAESLLFPNGDAEPETAAGNESAAADDAQGKKGAGQHTENAALQNVIQPEYYEQVLPFAAEASDGVVLTQEDDGSARFVVTDPEATVTLTFTGTEDAETYLLLQNLEVTSLQDWAEAMYSDEDADALSLAEETKAADTQSTAAALTVAEGAEDVLQEVYPITVTISRQGETLIDKTINYKTPINQYYSGWKDFALNMGYRTGAPDTITILFQHAGCYTVSGLSVIEQPMAELMTKSVERSVCTLQNVDLHQNPISLATDEITGTLGAEQDRILVFNIPYSTGWTAYDNGEKVELQKANLMYLAMPAAAGSHEIRLVYHTPGGRAGVLVSIMGILLMVWMAATHRS